MIRNFARSLAAAFALACVAAGVPVHAAGVFISGGASGNAERGFEGGWGFGAGLIVPTTPVADFVVRIDAHAVPQVYQGISWYPITPASPGVDAFGVWPEGAGRLSLASVMGGVRVHSDQRLGIYAEALVGLAHANPSETDYRYAMPAYAPVDGTPTQGETNLGMSFGAGVRFLSIGQVGMFADAHFDFCLLEKVPDPVIPIRVGLDFGLGQKRKSSSGPRWI